MWPFTKRNPDPVVPRISIKPDDTIIFSVAMGSYSTWLFPYQYVNWALEQLGEQPTCRVGDNPTFGMYRTVQDACIKYAKEHLNGL